MGMSIEEIVQGIEVIKAQAEWDYPLDWQIVLDGATDTMRKYQQLEDFARWIAVEVIDEELWTYNYLSFAELACRKLVKLGIMQESDGEYTYEVVEDGNND